MVRFMAQNHPYYFILFQIYFNVPDPLGRHCNSERSFWRVEMAAARQQLRHVFPIWVRCVENGCHVISDRALHSLIRDMQKDKRLSPRTSCRKPWQTMAVAYSSPSMLGWFKSQPFDNISWLVVWNILCFSAYPEEQSQLTNIFHMGWNHQAVRDGL